MKRFLKILPCLFVALFAAEIIAVFVPKQDRGLHVREFGRLPVLLNGRIQPFDSVARNSLLQIRSTGDVPLEEVPSWKFWKHPKKLKSTEWLLEVMFRPEQADDRPVFLIHHPDLLGELKLKEKGIEKSGLRYYSFNQIQPVLAEAWDQGMKARQVDEKRRSTFQQQVIKLQNAVFLYTKLKSTLRPVDSEDFAAELARFESAIPAGVAAVRAKEAGSTYDEAAFERFWQPVTQFFSMANDSTSGTTIPLTVPPTGPRSERGEWVSAGTSLMESVRRGEIHPAMKSFATMATAYRQENVSAFNTAVADYKTWLSHDYPREVSKGRREFFFNDTKSFLHAIIIYIAAFVLACVALLTSSLAPGVSESFRRSGFYLMMLAGAVHTFGLVFRMVLEGRPPVTNLYSSAIFIGWGAMVFGLGLEKIFKVGLGVLVGSVAGFVTLFIAHNLALGGDTMEMLRAVLDTNFWLATHVVVITLGYTATFVAGLLAIAYLVLGVFTPTLSNTLTQRSAVALSAASVAVSGPAKGIATAKALSGQVGKSDIGKILAKMVYGIICFATLFSFVGTILGGIWADQSWGRFWGWDPKENGALMIVLWNATILHARWGGLVRERGLMNMAIVGNIITSFSWFGVNMLGIGLHSYGFTDAAFKWLVLFIASQLTLIALGSVPLRLWRSFRVTSPLPA
jgi:cytochrome c-type biogenesis protein CcsB